MELEHQRCKWSTVQPVHNCKKNVTCDVMLKQGAWRNNINRFLTFNHAFAYTLKTLKMGKPEIKENPGFLEYVYELNEGIELKEALTLSLEKIDDLDIAQLNRIGLKTYEKGKWTVHRILQHLIDWERIWCFRAIIFARGEGTIPVAHDQEIMGQNSNADELSIEQLVAELRIVRQSTIMLFDSFNKNILETNCMFFEYQMPLYAIGLTIAAHQIHHFNIIEERYIPLDG